MKTPEQIQSIIKQVDELIKTEYRPLTHEATKKAAIYSTLRVLGVFDDAENNRNIDENK